MHATPCFTAGNWDHAPVSSNVCLKWSHSIRIVQTKYKFMFATKRVLICWLPMQVQHKSTKHFWCVDVARTVCDLWTKNCSFIGCTRCFSQWMSDSSNLHRCFYTHGRMIVKPSRLSRATFLFGDICVQTSKQNAQRPSLQSFARGRCRGEYCCYTCNWIIATIARPPTQLSSSHTQYTQ